MISSNKSQFSLTHLNGNRFRINKLNPQNVMIKRSTLTFDNGTRYGLNNYDLSYFLSNTKFEKYNFTDEDLLLIFCKDLYYDTNHGDRKSDGRKLILSLRSIRHIEGKGLEIVFLSSNPKK